MLAHWAPYFCDPSGSELEPAYDGIIRVAAVRKGLGVRTSYSHYELGLGGELLFLWRERREKRSYKS